MAKFTRWRRWHRARSAALLVAALSMSVVAPFASAQTPEEVEEKILSLFSASTKSMDDDRVTLVYDFEKKNPRLADDWTPDMASTKGRVRWSRGYEGTYSTVEDGLVIGDSGMWVLEARFLKDVSVTVDFLSVSQNRPRTFVGPVLYHPKKKTAIGTNDGRQLAQLKGTRVAKAYGSAAPLVANQRHTIGFKFDGEVMDAYTGTRRQESSSKIRGFASSFDEGCHPGLVWDEAQCFIFSVTIEGKLDPAWVAEKIGDPAEGDDKKKSKTRASALALEYVKENFKEHFDPTSVSFNEDGTADITFDFRRKNPEHEKIFSPNVDRQIQSDFRWTVRGEESWLSYTDGRSSVSLGGLRIGNKGLALLDLYFLDNVSVEIEYEQGVNQNARQSMTVMLFNDKNKRAIGSNFGTQCVTLRGGRLAGRPAGRVETLLTNQRYKLKLEVKEGVFKAFRNGREQAKKSYRPKDFESGRIGMSWNGGLAGIITSMTIHGEIDADKMLKIMRKKRRR